MCGILGIATIQGCRPSTDVTTLERMRDRLTHRGPDGAGLQDFGHVILAHRRLAVVDPTPAGAQPMCTPDGRCAITYNGELYNDAEVRADLMAAGVRFSTACDTETVLLALATWGAAGLERLRGMFALGFVNLDEGTLLLARDPLGIKPLYYWRGEREGQDEVVFASEPRAILTDPSIGARPCLQTVSAYLTTIRTTIDDRTLFEGVRTLRPGEAITVSMRSKRLVFEQAHWWDADRDPLESQDDVAGIVHESVMRHLRSDVPLCCLLSGGLDSSIIASVTSQQASLRTYCSGARNDDVTEGEDFEFARLVADHLRTVHTDAPISRSMFSSHLEAMVTASGVPLSTPNEVAIFEVASRLRADGCVVALSGEGADELFAGYEAPLKQMVRWLRENGPGSDDEGGVAQLHANAWTPLQAKQSVFREDILPLLEGDQWLVEHYRDEFRRHAPARRVRGDDELGTRLQAHVRFHRRINLAGLLLRLDSATMLASVEGRTPFADIAVRACAETLPMSRRFRPPVNDDEPAVTKLALREAFATALPASVVARPKASFPLPFQTWLEDLAPTILEAPLLREWFSPMALSLVANRPTEHWALAWPMVNLAAWTRAWDW